MEQASSAAGIGTGERLLPNHCCPPVGAQSPRQQGDISMGCYTWPHGAQKPLGTTEGSWKLVLGLPALLSTSPSCPEGQSALCQQWDGPNCANGALSDQRYLLGGEGGLMNIQASFSGLPSGNPILHSSL